MANEAVNIELPKLIVNRTCAEGVAIPMGTIMKLTDPNTVEASAADNDPFGGITTEEFTGGEDLTHVACALDGVWDLKDAGAGFTVGATVNIGGANTVVGSAAADLLTGSVVGKAEETAGAAEVVRIRVGGA